MSKHDFSEKSTPVKVVLYTNRNCMVFNAQGKQILYYQKAISCYKTNKKVALELSELAKEFYLGNWREWMHPITKKEFQYLLGIRTRKMDLAE